MLLAQKRKLYWVFDLCSILSTLPKIKHVPLHLQKNVNLCMSAVQLRSLYRAGGCMSIEHIFNYSNIYSFMLFYPHDFTVILSVVVARRIWKARRMMLLSCDLGGGRKGTFAILSGWSWGRGLYLFFILGCCFWISPSVVRFGYVRAGSWYASWKRTGIYHPRYTIGFKT